MLFFKEATVDICSFVLHNSHNDLGDFIRLEDFKGDMEVQKQKVLEALADKSCGYYYETDQTNFSKIPGFPIAYWVSEKLTDCFEKFKPLSNYSYVKKGLSTGEDDRYLRFWYEINITKFQQFRNFDSSKWFKTNKGGPFRRWYGNNIYVLNWENDGAELKSSKKSVLRNKQFYFSGKGITYTYVTSGKFNARFFDDASFMAVGPSIFPFDKNKLNLLLGFLNTSVAQILVNSFSGETITYEIGEVCNIPISFKYDINDIVKINIELSKTDWDSYETSWDFKHNPLL